MLYLTRIYCQITNHHKMQWLKQHSRFFLTVSWLVTRAVSLSAHFSCDYSRLQSRGSVTGAGESKTTWASRPGHRDFSHTAFQPPADGIRMFHCKVISDFRESKIQSSWVSCWDLDSATTQCPSLLRYSIDWTDLLASSDLRT